MSGEWASMEADSGAVNQGEQHAPAMRLRAKEIQHRYVDWRLQLNQLQRIELNRIKYRPLEALTFYQQLIMTLVTILDEGGETTVYIRDLEVGE